ncbi:MAG TPA: chain length determinant protein EpsF [Candidatus Desulfobacillus sp.]|mgnify:CR=1 FL=1|nr:chain length determinant protein EpsF [Candidatus Desulfobacillus sp.]
MNLQQFLLILLARWRVVAWTLFATVATTLIVSLLLPSQYTADTAVVVDVKSPDPILGTVMPGLISPGYMATQIDIINSDKVAYRVIRMLKLADNPTVQAQWRDDTDGRGAIEPWLAKLLKKKLDVKPSRESNVIAISYTASEPKFAQAMANAFAEAYIESSIDLRAEPAKQYATWFDERTRQLREQLEAAQGKLSAYQREKGIVAGEGRLDIENARLAELSTQLAIAQGQKADTQSRQAQTRASSDTLPEVVQNSLIQGLRADLARQESKLKEIGAQLGENHPQYKQLQAQIDELRARVSAETSRVAGSVGTANLASRMKESELQAAIEAQKARVLELKQQYDELAVLQREVESAQRAFDLVSQRLTQTSLESQVSQTNLVLLSPAAEPIEPSSPKILLNTLIAVFLGTLLGVGGALLMELMDRRVRAVEDIAELINLPVLGIMEAASGRAKRRWLFRRAAA